MGEKWESHATWVKNGLHVTLAQNVSSKTHRCALLCGDHISDAYSIVFAGDVGHGHAVEGDVGICRGVNEGCTHVVIVGTDVYVRCEAFKPRVRGAVDDAHAAEGGLPVDLDACAAGVAADDSAIRHLEARLFKYVDEDTIVRVASLERGSSHHHTPGDRKHDPAVALAHSRIGHAHVGARVDRAAKAHAHRFRGAILKEAPLDDQPRAALGTHAWTKERRVGEITGGRGDEIQGEGKSECDISECDIIRV